MRADWDEHVGTPWSIYCPNNQELPALINDRGDCTACGASLLPPNSIVCGPGSKLNINGRWYQPRIIAGQVVLVEVEP